MGTNNQTTCVTFTGGAVVLLQYRDGMEMTWEDGRKLRSLTKSGLSVEYAYNDSGIRNMKNVNGERTLFYLNGSSIVRQEKLNEENAFQYGIDFFYDANGDLFGFEYANNKYYYVRNGQNDIIGILDNTGTQVVSYEYDTWGKLLGVSGNTTLGNLNPFRYRGYYYDSETGLYYLNSRYYDPETGRFINADGMTSTGQGLLGNNMFAYCSNNPVNMFDPSGHVGKPVFLGYDPITGMGATMDTMPDDYVLGVIVNTIDPNQPPDHPNFTPPKKGNKKVKSPNGNGKGWVDKKGNVWVPTPNMDGGEGWTVQYPNGGHEHAYPGGHVRKATRNSNVGAGIGTIIGATIFLGILIADDYFGIVADDGLIPASIGCYSVGWDQIQGTYTCDVCGESWKGF